MGNPKAQTSGERFSSVGRLCGRSAAYSYPRVIHGSAESPKGLLAAASVNNSAAKSYSVMNFIGFSILGKTLGKTRIARLRIARLDARRLGTVLRARRCAGPLTNTQWRTASLSRSHYKPFAGISQRVFLRKFTTQKTMNTSRKDTTKARHSGKMNTPPIWPLIGPTRSMPTACKRPAKTKKRPVPWSRGPKRSVLGFSN